MGPLEVALEFIPYCLYWPFWNLFSPDGYLAQAVYSREGLGPYPKHCALPSPRSGWGVGWGGRWKEWEEGLEWELGLICKMRKNSLLSL